MDTPILVTGAHRSGTTWIGKMLTVNQNLTYISEPLNVLHRPGIFREPVQNWYTYICEENQSSFLPAIHDTINFKYHYWLELKSLRSFKDIGRMLRDSERFLSGRIRKTRPLLKDPFAIFSAPWFAQKLNCQVVIVVRHPLAFVSSLKRLGWSFQFQDFLSQPLLMRDHLERYRDDMLANSADVITQGCLLWRIVYGVVDRFCKLHPDFIAVRHEDLSRDPENGFQSLYSSLGLNFTQKVQQALQNSTKSGNPEELSTHHVHSVKLDSRANLLNWQKRLTDNEIIRIRNLTADIAHIFYQEETWN